MKMGLAAKHGLEGNKKGRIGPEWNKSGPKRDKIGPEVGAEMGK